MRIAVVGASGVLGRHLLPRLAARGHEVTAVVRDPARIAPTASSRLEIAQADILDAASLRTALAFCDAAIHIATAVQRPGGPSNWPMNDRIRREGTANLIAACIANGVTRYVQQSIAFLVPSIGEEWVDETSPVDAEKVLQSALDMERLVMASGLDWRILRGGSFYGPGTGMDEHWVQSAREGSLRLPGEGSDYVSLIHVADYAQAAALAVEAGQGSLVLNVVDDDPVTYRTLFGTIAACMGAPPPLPGGEERLASFRSSNRAAKEALGWRPFYADFRAGLLAGLDPPKKNPGN